MVKMDGYVGDSDDCDDNDNNHNDDDGDDAADDADDGQIREGHRVKLCRIESGKKNWYPGMSFTTVFPSSLCFMEIHLNY